MTTSDDCFELQLHDPAGLGAARAALRGWLADRSEHPDLSGEAELVVSELLTNALVHARGAAVLRADLRSSSLRLEVRDTSPAAPVAHEPRGPLGGYGLHIVEALSTGWGWRPTPTGKTVWVELRRGPRSEARGTVAADASD